MIKKIINACFSAFFWVALGLIGLHFYEVRSPYYFPALTGDCTVGTTSFYLVDRSRHEIHQVESFQPYREFTAQCWYPCDALAEQKSYLPYDIRSWKAALMRSRFSSYFLSSLNHIFTHASPSESPSAVKTSYPVIIIDHAIGSVGSSAYVGLGESLASHGYFVIAMNHTYGMVEVTFPDGRVVSNASMPDLSLLDAPERRRLFALEQDIWIQDIQFLLQHLHSLNEQDPVFKGKLNLQEIGIVGHSFGGSVAAQLCRIDPRIKVGINMDGALRGNDNEEPINKPFLFLMQDREGLMHDETFQVFKKSGGLASFITVKGVSHEAFSDEALIAQRTLLLSFFDGCVNGFSALDGLRAYEVTRSFVIEFFNYHIKHDATILFPSLEKYKEHASLKNS